MTTNQDRAAEVLGRERYSRSLQSAPDVLGRLIEHSRPDAQALADAGLLTPDPIAATPVPLEPGDRSFVIDCLMRNLQQANVLGSPGMAEAWGAAANAFAAATREKE